MLPLYGSWKAGKQACLSAWRGLRNLCGKDRGQGMGKELGIYLDEESRARIEAGTHNFYGRLIRAFEGRGFAVSLHDDSASARHQSARRPGYSLFHHHPPSHGRALQLRQTAILPFWHVEKARSRAQFRLARAEFRPDEIDGAAAKGFFRFWRRKLIAEGGGDAGGHVLVLLQRDLLAPAGAAGLNAIEMIRATLDQERFRRVVLLPDPDAALSEPEMQALEALADGERVALRRRGLGPLLAGCDYVVTQNAPMALRAVLHRKPVILFAEAEFHHVCLHAGPGTLARAYRNVLSRRVAYAKYFYWFLKLNCINAGAPDAGEQILQSCRHFGWEL